MNETMRQMMSAAIATELGGKLGMAIKALVFIDVLAEQKEVSLLSEDGLRKIVLQMGSIARDALAEIEGKKNE